MSWQLYRWVWRLDAPLFVGMPPAGSVNRTRLYVPARVLWGALTAELARHEAGDGEADHEQYRKIGDTLRDDFRFTYLYPAERTKRGWRAWLPEYLERLGLAWRREGGHSDDAVADRAFRARLLYTRPGTAIDPSSDTAEEGSLRETECVQARWCGDGGRDDGPVAMIGYVFARSDAGIERLDPIQALFVGGDSCYGLGRLVREDAPSSDARVFAEGATVEHDTPVVRARRVLAHASARRGTEMAGDLELLRGWDRGQILGDQKAPLWRPGSVATTPRAWQLTKEGLWQAWEDSVE